MFALDNSLFDLSKIAKMMDDSDFSNMFQMSELGAVDGASLMESQRKNVEALMKAQQVAASGFQSTVEKQFAMMQDAVSGMQAQMADLSKAPSATDVATQQVELAKKVYEDALANLNELAEIAQKTNTEAFIVIKDRVEASFEEMKAA